MQDADRSVGETLTARRTSIRRNTSADTLSTPSHRGVHVSREQGITGTHVSGAHGWVTLISTPATKIDAVRCEAPGNRYLDIESPFVPGARA